jgi:hypothetical protein
MQFNMNQTTTVHLNADGVKRFNDYISQEANLYDLEEDECRDEYDFDPRSKRLSVPMFKLVSIFGTNNPNDEDTVVFWDNTVALDPEHKTGSAIPMEVKLIVNFNHPESGYPVTMCLTRHAHDTHYRFIDDLLSEYVIDQSDINWWTEL